MVAEIEFRSFCHFCNSLNIIVSSQEISTFSLQNRLKYDQHTDLTIQYLDTFHLNLFILFSATDFSSIDLIILLFFTLPF